MTTLNLIVIWISLIECTAGIFVLLWCALRDDPRRRAMWGAIAALSAVYACGYVWLLSGADILTWSNVFRGVTPLAWPVWSVPALVITRQHRRDVAALRKTAK